MPTPSPVGTQPFWSGFDRFGDRTAVLTADGALTYARLAERIAAVTAALGDTRRLVVVESERGVDTVIGYLAGLAGGHVVALVPDAAAVDAYDPDAVVSGGRIEERRSGTRHELHPDLALLLSTSGSTGSPKLVRLSHANLNANATAIATYLGIRGTDVAPMTLPLHYCYGLSVLNSHLAVGAALVLTDEPLTSPGFWSEFRSAGCTSLAGVPYTFELLDRVGFAEMELPALRYLTQAGGRMDPADVRRYAALGQRRGFDLFVMYGATEATARMAYLPPDLALTCPEAIGFAIPGGSLRVDQGELVYTGDNVMLGYAESPADLARGRDLSELRTGDLARLRPDGLVEVTGRAARIAKIGGLRIDLTHVEQVLGAAGVIVHCADGGDRVVVAVDTTARQAPTDLADRAAAAVGLPRRRVQVVASSGLPRLAGGKPDYLGIVTLASRPAAEPSATGSNTSGDLCALYADVLCLDRVGPADSFVSLRGDSLSYVELSIRLEAALGSLPIDWPTRSLRSLESLRRSAPARPRRGRAMETSVLLRATAILLIVASHSGLLALQGGAHVLLAVLGFNVGRFIMVEVPRRDRVRRLLTGAARVTVPAVAWLMLVVAWDPGVTWRNVVLLNGVLGTNDWTDPWQYWFVEAAVYLLLVLAVVAAVPWLDQLERRWPFGLPVALTIIALLWRYRILDHLGPHQYTAYGVAWLVLVGWATAKAESTRQRLIVSAIVCTTLPGYFDDDVARTLVVVGGILLLIWQPTVRVPQALTAPVRTLAGASLAIYLTHWQVYPGIEAAGFPVLATAASLIAGVAAWHGCRGALRFWLGSGRSRSTTAEGVRPPLAGAADPSTQRRRRAGSTRAGGA